MTELLLMIAPSANRVYAGAARALVAAEALVLTGVLCDRPVEVKPADLAGVEYLAVSAEGDAGDLVDVLSNLSACAALFEREVELLRPVPLRRREIYPSDLVTIPKYSGKTNEQWTRLVLGVTAAATARPQRWLDGSLNVLDPMCGRGTTLNLALSLGYDVTGVEIDRKDHEAYAAFIKTWMRTHRYKHTVQESALRTDGRMRGRRLQIEIAASKEGFRAGEVQHVEYLNTDTRDLDGLLRARSVDVVVADAPYGVQHGSQADELARSPLELLDQALPGWVRVLRGGGAVGLSYNRHVAPRDALDELLAEHGLQVRTGPGYDDLRHRVDASIDRDLIVATKP
ncbi:TRM11 family methyltransferase [Allobranchiibius sp. GilTou73]|uniref:TRM11 family SAM-dependent methyltransferase n=1 Tax=Allobranchiibius sp. GilTou73 TaxID=2904523 RepID=UPI001F35F331|nr:SAM-dependent methyltransferase [Allobranchiibius sp. GilTou73]UIJ34413.1 SAM-dependent methyltransferase [Allobranchiibius sp. GilTou73]